MSSILRKAGPKKKKKKREKNETERRRRMNIFICRAHLCHWCSFAHRFELFLWINFVNKLVCYDNTPVSRFVVLICLDRMREKINIMKYFFLLI